MGLRIRSNVASLAVQKNLRGADESQQNEFAKLSSGKRIVKSSDDAAGLGIAKKIEAEVKGLKMAQRNASNGIAMIQVAEGGLQESTNILTRLRELSIQSASDTVGEKEKGYLDLEFQQMTQEIDRISKSTTFSGKELLTGNNENGKMTIQVGANAGDVNRIEFDTEATNATLENLGLSGATIRDKEESLENLAKIDNAIDMVSGFRANFGAIQSRLQTAVNNIDTQALNQENARSVIEDVDIAESTATLASQGIIKQAGIMTLGQANNIPRSALSLIG
jgi:flagellin